MQQTCLAKLQKVDDTFTFLADCKKWDVTQEIFLANYNAKVVVTQVTRKIVQCNVA